MEDLDLTTVVERCRRRWPEIVPPRGLAAYVRQRVPPGPDDADWLAKAKLEDLYLASACCEGSNAALAVFEREHISRIPDYLARLRPTSDFVDEVMQIVRERIFVGRNGRSPRIGEYSGKGALGGWVRVLAMRAAIDLQRVRTEMPIDSVSASVATTSTGAEADYVKRRYGALLQAAIKRSIDALPQEQRTLLHLHFAEKATLDELAARYGNHPSTIWRKIAAARKAIVDNTHQLLRDDASIAPDDVASLLRTVRRELDISLSGLRLSSPLQ
jgi:RNA polymerase sigma-70 factor (ECF subfamily)